MVVFALIVLAVHRPIASSNFCFVVGTNPPELKNASVGVVLLYPASVFHVLLALNAVAPLNILVNVTDELFSDHILISWLKEVAPKNI